MRPTYDTESIVGTRSRVRVLRVLNGVSVPLNASQVAARSGLSQPAALTAIKELAGAGLVASSPAGRAWVHTLIRDNVYVQRMVEPLFAAEQGVVEDLADDLRRVFAPHAASVVLYGSYARGDQTPHSDIDVVLIGNDSTAATAIEALSATQGAWFRRRFGATLAPLVYAAEEAATLWRRAPALQESLEQDGLVVSGTAPWEWREGQADE